MYTYNYGMLYNAPAYGDSWPNFNMDYWARSLYQRISALIDFKGLPEAPYRWDKDALKYGLYSLGFLAVILDKDYGVVPQPATLTGYGIQYQPTGAMIATPYYHTERPLKIGVECELIKITPDYTGVFDIVTKYAAELKEIETSIKAAARNSRLAFAMIASNDKTARSLRAIKERIDNGQDAIIDKDLISKNAKTAGELPWYEFNQNVRENYILGDLLDARRTTLVDFYREIGVRMLDDKKERMITDEVDAGNAETFIRSEVWMEALKESLKKVNSMFGTDIKAVMNRPDLPGGSPEGGEDDAR